MISRKKFDTRLWWFLFLIAVCFLVLVTAKAQVVYVPIQQEEPEIFVDVYNNGVELMSDTTKIAFIYGDKPFGFKDGGFQVITVTGDTILIQIKRRVNE